MSADLSAPIRTAILAQSAITSLLSTYQGSYPVFTKRPVPDDAPYPMIVISENITVTNAGDGLDDERPVIQRDIAVYGSNEDPGQYRDVNAIALLVQQLFHRKRLAISVSGWYVSGIDARGPIDATGDDQIAARVVTLDIALAKRPQ